MTEKLAAYRAKRHPRATPEPMVVEEDERRTGRSHRDPKFVIHEHHARALHWDFRLERDGVLVSWALPKGLPESPRKNHLAVHTEDHPLQYEDFEGNIPMGEYGGGRVEIWDRGTYEVEKWRDDEVMVVLHGRRASGRYVLFKTKSKNWIIHRMEPAPENFDEMPEHVRPMLALAGDLPNSDEGWAYEFKWDGVRALTYVEGGRVRAYSRNDRDLMASFPELREIGELLGSRSAILDGEIVAFDDRDRPDFARLTHRLHLGSKSAVERTAKTTPAVFLVFDVLYLEGRNLMRLPFDERRRILESIQLNGRAVATPPAITDSPGREIVKISRERGLEGVVIKRRDSPYSPGQRNGDWVKLKNFHTQEVVIGGWTEGQRARAGSIGALLAGIPGDAGLEYVGKVGTGFSDSERRELLDLLDRIEIEASPFAGPLAAADRARAHFVAPELVGEVQYGEWTRDGRMRHPSWRGLRADKVASEVIRES